LVNGELSDPVEVSGAGDDGDGGGQDIPDRLELYAVEYAGGWVNEWERGIGAPKRQGTRVV